MFALHCDHWEWFEFTGNIFLFPSQWIYFIITRAMIYSPALKTDLALLLIKRWWSIWYSWRRWKLSHLSRAKRKTHHIWSTATCSLTQHVVGMDKKGSSVVCHRMKSPPDQQSQRSARWWPLTLLSAWLWIAKYLHSAHHFYSKDSNVWFWTSLCSSWFSKQI